MKVVSKQQTKGDIGKYGQKNYTLNHKYSAIEATILLRAELRAVSLVSSAGHSVAVEDTM